jgi:hypothetical protein
MLENALSGTVALYLPYEPPVGVREVAVPSGTNIVLS